jgi:hypothetical protein
LIDKHHEKIADAPRPHMGCSQLGHPCDRWLWLSFRWAVQPKFEGRLLRLFRRGQLEEATIVSDLRAIGMDVQMTGERQSRVKLGAHVSGSVDAVIESGMPEAPKKRHVAEFKTHNKKSFDLLEKDGVQKAKPEHYIQMQLYMHGLDIDRALYVAVCKDDDRIHTERVRYDKETASKYLARGQRIALSDRMPEPLSTDPTWYQCRWCPAHKFCHETKITEHVNCRTCAHSTAMPDSTWRCERHEADGIPVEFQRQGCDSHVLHPDMVPWPLGDSDSDHVATYLIDGKSVKNGDPADDVFTSRELLANATACASGDAGIKAMRANFDGRIVG